MPDMLNNDDLLEYGYTSFSPMVWSYLITAF